MPATRSRASTEQPAEVAPEDVKVQHEEPKEIVDSPVLEEVKTPGEAEAVIESVPEVVADVVPAVVDEVIPEVAAVETPVVVEEKVAENGTSEAVAEPIVEENGKADIVDEEADIVVEGIEKRKSIEVEGGDGPDSTEVSVKKTKVDEVEEVAAPVEEATA